MNLFKRKKEEPKTYEGRFISDNEMNEMIKPHTKSFISKEVDEMNEMVERMRHYGE